jgi:FkbM family methyltransferase
MFESEKQTLKTENMAQISLIKKAYLRIKSIFLRLGADKIKALHWVNYFFVQLIKSDSATVQGHKMFLDPHDSLNLSINEVYEKAETDLAYKEVKEGNVILDIGANIGYYTLIFAKLAGPNGKVYAFEPDPDNFAILKKNIETNGYQNVVLVNKAVSDSNGKIKLYKSDTNSGDHRIYDSDDGRGFTEIECVRLDDFFRGNELSVDLIKMDIQGAEYKALSGMAELIKKNHSIKILSEFWPEGLIRSGATPSAYLGLIENCGFKITELQNEPRQVESADLLKRYADRKETATNIFCAKS